MSMKHVSLAITVLVLESGLLLSAQEQAQLEMKFYAEEKAISMGEPVNIEFAAKNNARAPMALDLGLNRQGAFRFDIGAPDGTVAHVSAPALAGGADISVRISRVPLAPGETYKQLVRLSQWYSFPLPGTYVVTGHLAGERFDVIVDPAFTITIAAPDANRLRVKCEQLAARALDPEDAGGFDAGIDLSLIKDPIAVPYLERMLAGQPTARIAAIEGLARIGTLGATDSLLNFIGRADAEDHSRTVSRLVSLGRSTQRTEVRERIRAAGLLKE
jgi:hypothetical protein